MFSLPGGKGGDKICNLIIFIQNRLTSMPFIAFPDVYSRTTILKSLQQEAKILYGLMLDRVSLSLKNMWIDKSRRVYIIFTLKEVMDTLNCGDKKATRLMGELEKCGLIERDRRGLGKPKSNIC